MPDYIDEAKRIQDEYKRGLNYKKQMGFLNKWPEYERMRAGDQWPSPTENTKNMPRPVINIIKRIETHKVSSVMNENIKMVFSAEELPESEQGKTESPQMKAAELFTQFADTTWERIKQDELNEEALENASNSGTAIWHYYWEQQLGTGDKKLTLGDMQGEIIDPVNFFPGNPQQRKVQKQPYIIITCRDEVASVKREAEGNSVPADKILQITPDKETEDQGYDMAKQELNDSEKVTVITKYWKEKDGYIWFEKVASGVVIKPKTNTNMRLYPIVVMQWERRKQSIFGIGDTEGLIPNQRAINFLMAMQLLSVQLTGWPKIRINTNYIKQQIANIPGEVVYDNSPNGEGVGYINPAGMPAHVPGLVESFMSYTKEVTGATEDALGERSSKDLNATAIMLLQKASGVPIESIKRRFYRANEDTGRIWEEFWKVKYNIQRNITLKNNDGEARTVPFNGSDYKDIGLNLKIDIGPSSSYSETLMMSSLDKLFDGKYISLEQYLKLAPKNAMPFKEQLLKEIQQQQVQAMNDPTQILAHLSPQERAVFDSMPDRHKAELLQKVMGGQQMTAANNQQPQMQQPG